MSQTEKISLRIINALMEYINKCGDMGRIKQNNYANYIALKYIFLNLHKKRAARHFRQTASYYNRLGRLNTLLNYLFRSSASLPV